MAAARAHIFIGNRIRNDKTRADAISWHLHVRAFARIYITSRTLAVALLGTSHERSLPSLISRIRAGTLLSAVSSEEETRADAGGSRWSGGVLDRDRSRRHFGIISREEDLAEAPRDHAAMLDRPDLRGEYRIRAVSRKSPSRTGCPFVRKEIASIIGPIQFFFSFLIFSFFFFLTCEMHCLPFLGFDPCSITELAHAMAIVEIYARCLD